MSEKKSQPNVVARAIDKIISTISPKAGLVRKQYRAMEFRTTYEGGKYNRTRTPNSVRFESQDANLNAQGRTRIMSEARDLEDNVGLVKGINRMFGKYVCGKIRARARTGDDAINDAYHDYFEEFCYQADFTGRHTFEKMAQLAVHSMIRDGDIGFLKKRGPAFPQLQAIEADRIGNPYDTRRSPEYVLGVFMDANGRPTKYRLFNRGPAGIGFVGHTDVQAQDFIHMFDPVRFDQYRGVSAYHAAVSKLRDIKDILENEQAASKWGSAMTGIIEKMGGSVDSDVILQNEVNADGNSDKLETFAAGVLQYLQPGEKINAFKWDRPSEAFRGFLEFLIRDIAIGLELPFGFVWNMAALGGVPSRVESQQAARTFARLQHLLKDSFLNQVWCWVIADGIQQGRLPISENYYKVSWHFSAHPTVDVGRESAANLNENRQGLKSAADIYGEQGHDWKEQQEQCAKEAKHIQDLSIKYGVPVEQIRMLTPNGSGSAPAQGNEEDDAPTPPAKKKSTNGLNGESLILTNGHR